MSNTAAVNTATAETPTIGGINLDSLDDASLTALIAAAQARTQAQAPAKLDRIAQIKADIETLSEELKTLYAWCHTHNVRIPRLKADGNTDPDVSADSNPVAAKKPAGRPKKQS
jgi:hypothetical protein